MSASELTVATHRVGSVACGEVEIFYRRLGSLGATPVLILHGGNYYDSHDWIEVAHGLAGNREVVAHDACGFGESGWSPVQNYSLDAHVGDVATLLHHLQWERVVLVGHSKGSLHTLAFATAYPERVAGLVLVDFSPSHAAGGSPRSPGEPGPFGPVYASLKEALAATSRDPRSLEDAAKRVRLQMVFARRDGRWVNVRRDPRWSNPGPDDRPDWVSALTPFDTWEALASLTVPALVIRATQSEQSSIRDREGLAELHRRCPGVTVADVDSGHDVPGEAPAQLVHAARGFLSA